VIRSEQEDFIHTVIRSSSLLSLIGTLNRYPPKDRELIEVINQKMVGVIANLNEDDYFIIRMR
jgi:hypothetical protein